MLYSDLAIASPQFGRVMGVEPVAGRLFLTGNNSLKDPEEAMVSASFARENFGSARQALGQTLKYSGKLRVIVGVLPDGFSFPGKTQVWVEAPSAPDVENRTSYNQKAIAKVTKLQDRAIAEHDASSVAKAGSGPI